LFQKPGVPAPGFAFETLWQMIIKIDYFIQNNEFD